MKKIILFFVLLFATNMASAQFTTTNDSEYNSLIFNELFNASHLQNISGEFPDIMNTMVNCNANGQKTMYNLIFKEVGPGRTDLIITVEPVFLEEYLKNNPEGYPKSFPKGVYDYLYVNNNFEGFAIGVRDDFSFEDSNHIEAWIHGEADGYPLLKDSSGVKYEDMSDIWGDINYTTHDGQEFNLSPMDPIDNSDLAFLRAWHVKYLFEKTVEQPCATQVTTTDYSIEDPSKKNYAGTYRKADIKCFILNYYFGVHESLKYEGVLNPDITYHNIIIRDINM